MKILKNVFVSILILFFFTNNSWSKSASEFISSLSIEASNILSSKLSEDEKIVRLHIGLEDPKDLIADLKKALKYIK